MQRVTMSLDDALIAEFDRWMASRGYANRSEALRDLIRERLDADRLVAEPETPCLAVLTYVFDHEVRALPSRLTKVQHERHDLTVATLHIHLGHESCLETMILRGAAPAVRGFADRLLAQPGVRAGRVHLIPVEVDLASHDHGSGADGPHLHARPRV